jgi:glycosyltransferase involved in cell wall biosynthesis
MPEAPQLPPIATAPLSVVLPARNEQAHLEVALLDWLHHLETLQRDYELLLVDDGSTDQTPGIAQSLTGRFPRLRLLRHPSPRGLGAALRTGLTAAHHPLFFYSACGNAYEPAELKLLLEVIDTVHLATGYRVGSSPTPRSPTGFAARWLLRWSFGVRLRDVDCAFKLFRRQIFARIPIQSDGTFAQTEIIAKANFLGCLMTEVPVRYRSPGGADATKWRDTPGQVWGDRKRVFQEPDFGPARVPADSILAGT